MSSPEYPIAPLGAQQEYRNQQTRHAYNADAAGYDVNTVVDPNEHHPAKTWIRYALDVLDQRSEIKHLPVLEIGSGTGRDADYLESQGVSVRRTDATSSFLQTLRSKGHTADMLDALTDELGGPYRMVFANGVFPHFSDSEVRLVIDKSFDSLAPDGLLVLSLKVTDVILHWHMGTVEGWDIAIPPNWQKIPPKVNKERYYYVRHPVEARRLMLTGDHGRSVTFMEFDTERSQWLGVVMCKNGVGEVPDNYPRRSMPFPPLDHDGLTQAPTDT